MFLFISKIMRITSPSNPRIKNIVRLQEGRIRREMGLFLINGEREIVRAIECGVAITEIYHCNDNSSLTQSTSSEYSAFLQKIQQSTSAVFEVSEQVFEKIAFGQRREGMVAVAQIQDESNDIQWENLWKQFDQRNEEIRKASRSSHSSWIFPLFAVVEHVEKPGNLGAIFRSADGAGIDAIFIADPLCDLYNPNTIRSSLGTVFRVPAIIDSSQRILQELTLHHITIAAARCDERAQNNLLYTQYDFTQPTAIVLGTEADGLSTTWDRPEIQPIYLPMLGIADSLNVSNAAAVLFYEARRQKKIFSC